jgi:hypothetical protein
MTESTMYTLGQLARAIWSDGSIPVGTLDLLLSSPSAALGRIMRMDAARRLAKDYPVEIGRIVAKLPADLPDSVPVVDQGDFWLGWYGYSNAISRAASLGPEHIARAGNLLFGDRWQSDLARAVGVGDRRVREWMSGDRRPPAGVWAEIAALLRQRGREGEALLRELSP